jgi:hypothetical protein
MMRIRLGALLAATCVTLITRGASADAVKDADRLFREAVALREKDDIVPACEKFAESQKLDPSSGTLLNIGQCNETFGRWASAVGAYEEAEVLAKKRNKTEHAKKAEARRLAIAGKVPHLVLDRAAIASQNAAVLLDGKVTKDDKISIDPGQHVLEVEAAGFERYINRLTVVEGKDLPIKLPTLSPAAGAQATKEPQGAIAEKKPIIKTEEKAAGLPLVPGLVISGVGVLGVGAGVILSAMASSSLKEAKAGCTDYPKVCSATASDPNKRAQTFSLLSTISWIGGGVLLAGGITWIAISLLGGEAEVKPTQGGAYVSFQRTF